MKKVVKKDGIPRAELSIVPQVNIPCPIWNDIEATALELKATLREPRTFMISASVGGTALASIHHVPEEHICRVALILERHAWDVIDRIDKEEGTEFGLLNIGYTI